MSTQGSSSQLEAAWRDLAAAWQHVTDDWRDARAKEFEQMYLERLPNLIMNARRAIEDIDGLLRKMRRECE
jgi:hypothetical protein